MPLRAEIKLRSFGSVGGVIFDLSLHSLQNRKA